MQKFRLNWRKERTKRENTNEMKLLLLLLLHGNSMAWHGTSHSHSQAIQSSCDGISFGKRKIEM